MGEIKKQEFIGLPIKIIESKNKSLIGIKGTIMDETKNTFKIKIKDQEKTIIKNQITFTTKINNKEIKIKGKSLVKKPEERIK